MYCFNIKHQICDLLFYDFVEKMKRIQQILIEFLEDEIDLYNDEWESEESE